MPTEIRMPKLSDTMEEGTIVRWLKNPGDTVQQGEPLAEVETDKADVELEASTSGVLREIRVAQGQGAAVGQVIAVLGDAAEAGAAAPPEAKADSAPAAAAPAPAKAKAAPAEAPAPSPAAVVSSEAPARTVRASPLAWRLAEDAGVNLNGVKGSGPGGRIVKRDIERALAKGRGEPEPAARAASVTAPKAVDAADLVAPPAERVEELSRMRRAIAQRMAEAKREIPHFYVGAEIDMSEAMRLRQTIKEADAIPGLTVTHVLIRAAVVALGRHPRVNASFVDGKIAFHADVNIGIAVALDDGLIVPVLHRAQALSLGEIAAGAARLTERARAGKFSGEDLAGGTFSISNVGRLDVDELVAVITPPQAAILGVGAVKERPVVRGGALAVGQTLRAVLSCNHRVVNGLEGAAFLAEVKGLLERPALLLLP